VKGNGGGDGEEGWEQKGKTRGPRDNTGEPNKFSAQADVRISLTGGGKQTVTLSNNQRLFSFQCPIRISGKPSVLPPSPFLSPLLNLPSPLANTSSLLLPPFSSLLHPPLSLLLLPPPSHALSPLPILPSPPFPSLRQSPLTLPAGSTLPGQETTLIIDAKREVYSLLWVFNRGTVSIYDALNRATWLQLTLENVKRVQVTFSM
jgi:hypothetical protein